MENTSSTLPRWEDVAAFITASIQLQELNYKNALHDATILNTMLTKVGVQEPFLMDLSKHPPFSKAREEKFSDYLAWIIEQIAAEPAWILKLFNISEKDLDSSKIEGRIPIIKRENVVAEGRIDILILYEDVLIDIEVKVVDAESADVAKNAGYRESLKANYSMERYKQFHRLLVTGALNDAYNREPEDECQWYWVVKWSEVCLRLRQLILESSVLKDKLLLKALVVSFAGSVEQTLLGYQSLTGQKSRNYIDTESSKYISDLLKGLQKVEVNDD